MNFKAILASAGALLATSALAQTETTVPATAVSSQMPSEPSSANISISQRLVPVGTLISITPLAEITSKKVEVGEKYQFSVVADVVENGVVAIPRGTLVTGAITWKTGRAIGGKSGKFELDFESLTLANKTYLLTGKHRQEGRGNTVGALLGSIWISGRSASMLPGQLVNAITREPIPY